MEPEKIEIGYTIPKERWLEAARNLEALGSRLAGFLAHIDANGHGKEEADALASDVMLACLAMNYVAECAVDKCRFIPLPGGDWE
uniref:Uncharacterized protein n=1 Tax=Dulem virus 34 TaxID=3145752 RepID=A0AAU8B4V9_9CAUD